MIRLSLLLLGCLALSGCETMREFYDEVIVASVNETIVDPTANAELSYCAGCDWIVQEFHDAGWETRNSKPYDTEDQCRAAKREQQESRPPRHVPLHSRERTTIVEEHLHDRRPIDVIPAD